MLSAQCTDERVNKVTSVLFKDYGTPQKMATLTQEKLAELCDCSSQTISGTETGYSFPSSKVLFKLAENLHVPLTYLFNFGEDPVVSNKEEDSSIIELLSNLSIESKRIIIKIIKAFE